MSTWQRGLPPPEQWPPELCAFLFYAGPTGVLASLGLWQWAALWFAMTLAFTVLVLRDLDP